MAINWKWVPLNLPGTLDHMGARHGARAKRLSVVLERVGKGATCHGIIEMGEDP